MPDPTLTQDDLEKRAAIWTGTCPSPKTPYELMERDLTSFISSSENPAMAFDTDLDAYDGIFAVTRRNGRKARLSMLRSRSVLDGRNGSRRSSITRATASLFIR